EDVTRISFTTGRTTQQQRHLTVSNSLLGQVVICDQRVLAVVTEIFAHRSAGERRQVLQRSRVRSGSSNDDRVFESATLFEDLHQLCNGRALLADCDIDAVELLALIVAVDQRLLVKEGVENDRGLTGLTVTNNQLTLAATNRDQSVASLEAGRHWLMNRLAGNNARRLDVDASALLRVDWTLAVDRIAERVNNAAEQFRTNRNVHDRAGALDGVAFLDVAVGTENNDTDIVGFKVERHAAN